MEISELVDFLQFALGISEIAYGCKSVCSGSMNSHEGIIHIIKKSNTSNISNKSSNKAKQKEIKIKMSSTTSKNVSKVPEITSPTTKSNSTPSITTSISKISVPEGRFKLYYFPINGRAFAARVALKSAGFDYEDIRITPDEFKEFRKGKNDAPYNENVPLGQLPVLVFPDGKQIITQSNAIARYAGKYNGLYPSDPLKSLVADEIMDVCSDLLTLMPQSQDPQQRKILREKYVAEQFPKYFGFLASKLEQSGGPFLLGENLTVADLAAFAMVDIIGSGFFDFINEESMKPYKTVLELRDIVKTHPIVVQSKAL